MTDPTTREVIPLISLTDERQVDVIFRLKSVRGQIDGLIKMTEEGRTCAALLTQIAAAIQALRGVQEEVLRNYLETCVRTAILEGREDIYNEVVKVFHTYHS